MSVSNAQKKQNPFHLVIAKLYALTEAKYERIFNDVESKVNYYVSGFESSAINHILLNS